nr:MAG: major capsid protein [Microviridae sp.]
MGKSYVQEQFARAQAPKIERSVFDRSRCHKTTFNSGFITPVYLDHALPGDSFKGKMTVFARLSTALKTPIMDNLYMDIHFFAIPYRLVWEHWQNFCGEVKSENWGQDGLSTTDYVIPQIHPVIVGKWFPQLSMADYFGLPTDQSITTANYGHISVLPFRAYNLVWNEWYRDENLQQPLTVRTDDGGGTLGDETDFNYPLQKRNRRKDYFTSALPWPQKGQSVDIPIGTAAPVYGTGRSLAFTDTTSDTPTASQMAGTTSQLPTEAPGFYLMPTEDAFGAYNGSGGIIQEDNWSAINWGVPSKKQIAHMGINGPEDSGLYADLTEATAATINQLRQAFQMQKMLERDARGGTRYVEIIKSHFGVTSPDARLQRPEYLGGGHIRFQTNPVQQTSETTANSPQGNLRAFSVGCGKTGFSKSFVEHTIILGLASVRADNTYQQGVHKSWAWYTREDFYWPSFAHLGEQAILNREIYADGSENDLGIFGYQERYAEYRYLPSMVTGQMRSTYADIPGTPDSLDSWHLAMDFDQLPILADVIKEEPPIQRVVAIQWPAPEIIFDSYMELRCARPMPVYSVPGLIDHF